MTVFPIAPIPPAGAVRPERVAGVEAKASRSADGDFAALVDRAAESATPRQTTAVPATTGAPIRPLVAHEAREAPPLEQFEGFALRTFVETMLPSEDSGFFGKGTAGQMWRSMLAEHIGNELAKGGGIGIAAAIAGKGGTPGGADAALREASAADALDTKRLDADPYGVAGIGRPEHSK